MQRYSFQGDLYGCLCEKENVIKSTKILFLDLKNEIVESLHNVDRLPICVPVIEESGCLLSDKRTKKAVNKIKVLFSDNCFLFKKVACQSDK